MADLVSPGTIYHQSIPNDGNNVHIDMFEYFDIIQPRARDLSDEQILRRSIKQYMTFHQLVIFDIIHDQIILSKLNQVIKDIFLLPFPINVPKLVNISESL